MAELNHVHTGYDNFVLESVIEDQYTSKLDLMDFCVLDNSLVGKDGMKKTVNVYTATENNTEKLKMGEGNTKKIEVKMVPKDFEILLYQNQFPWYDEELKKDPTIVKTGVQNSAVDMFNTTRADIMAEFNKAKLEVLVDAYNFNAFVDAIVKLDLENAEGVKVDALVNPELNGEIRKALGDDLKYVEAYARAGYIGTVAGVNIYTTKFVNTAKGIVVFIKGAVKYFNKVGSEVEPERTDANKRLNTLYTRKYGFPAFYDETKAVCIKLKTAVSEVKATSK